MSTRELRELDKILVKFQRHLESRYVLHPGESSVIDVRRHVDHEIQKSERRQHEQRNA